MFDRLQIAINSNPIPSRTIKNVRDTRNTLLQISDWTQLPDSPLSPEKKAEWAAYRQQLRDITEQNINSVVWPKEPE